MTYFPGGKSPWPANYLLVEMFISGSWVAVSMSELSDDGIQIIRGGKAGSRQQEPGSLTFSLKDPTGKWSPRHPSSPYYGLIGRGTRIRVRVRNHGTGAYFNRFYGEIVSFTPAWTRVGGKSARVDVEASGVLRRLGQGKATVFSPYKHVMLAQTGLVGYWPMEDPADSVEYASALDAGPFTAVFSGVVAAQSSSLRGSDPLPNINNGQLRTSVPAYTPTSTLQLRSIIKNGAATGSGTIYMRYLFTGGTLGYIDCIYNSSTALTLSAYRSDGTLINSMTTGYNTGVLIFMHQIDLTQVGSAVTMGELCLTNTNVAGTNSISLAATTIGRVKSILINSTAGSVGDSIVGHVSVATAINSYNSTIFQSMNAWSGETALSRIVRLTDEAGIPINWTNGPWTSPRSEPMGYQSSGELMDLIQECVEVDLGILRESTTDAYELFYNTQGSMFSPRAADRSDFAYVENLFNPFVPVEDDQDLRNVVTVARNVGGGGEATSMQETGPLGTNTVGIYDESVSLNLDTPFSVRAQADWRVHLGTWDEARWPQIGVDLADKRILGQQAFQEKVLNRDIGQVINITGIPSWLPPFPVSQIITGITEVITDNSHTVVWDCSPAKPLRVGHFNEAVDRYSGEGTTAPTLTTTATSFTVVPPTGVTWTHADGDYDILIDGEQMTVKNVVGNVFTVVRSVNGIVKTHTAGALITLADPALWAL